MHSKSAEKKSKFCTGNEDQDQIEFLFNSKSQLGELLKSKVVIPFHQKVCVRCPAIPNAEGWQKAEIMPDMNIFHVGKRV